MRTDSSSHHVGKPIQTRIVSQNSEQGAAKHIS